MLEYYNQLPEMVQEHIKLITKTSGLEENEESYDKIAYGWLEKQKTFDEEIQNMDMEEVEYLGKDDNRGALAMTYSGSIINYGPNIEGKRKVAYASIGLREDVPDLVVKDDCELQYDLLQDESYEFVNGPVKKTSPIYKIIVCKEQLNEEEQEEVLNQVATIVIDDFVEVNKTIIMD